MANGKGVLKAKILKVSSLARFFTPPFYCLTVLEDNALASPCLWTLPITNITHTPLFPPCSLLSICSHLFSTPFRKGQEWTILGLLLLGGIFPITLSAPGKLFLTTFCPPMTWEQQTSPPCSGHQAAPKSKSICKRVWKCLGLTQLHTTARHKERGESMPSFVSCTQPLYYKQWYLPFLLSYFFGY